MPTRRSLFPLALAALPTRLFAQAANALAPRARPSPVPAGADREAKPHAVGVSSTRYKVLTAETAGAMFVLEQTNQKHGGPNLHLHHAQDELFYVLEGEYLVEVGPDLFHLHPGDCVLGPREIPHAWAFVGPTTGRLLLSYAPAGQMEAFFNQREQLGVNPGGYSTPAQADILSRFGMQLLGPPINLDAPTRN